MEYEDRIRITTDAVGFINKVLKLFTFYAKVLSIKNINN